MLCPEFLVYVAAPFTPTAAQKARIARSTSYDYSTAEAVQDNKAAAAALGLEVAGLGCMPIVPHTAHGGRPELEFVQDYDFWIKSTAALLRRCDAALFSSNWEESGGARSEHAKCVEWGIPIFYTLQALREWLEGTEIVEEEALLALHMRIVDALAAEQPIPYRLPSELPSPSKYPTTDATFGKLDVPPAPSLPRIEGYDNGDGGLDQ